MKRMLCLLGFAAVSAAGFGQAGQAGPAGPGIQDREPNRFGDRFTVDAADPLTGTAIRRVSNHTNVFTHRAGDGGDNLSSETITNYLEHGWVNTPEQQMNVNSQMHSLFLNSDAQVGGIVGLALAHYGKGDGVGLAEDLFCTGVNRGSDEGCEALRIWDVPHSDNAGFQVETVERDKLGETILRGPRDGNGVPTPLPGHTARAASENALLIDLNPAKTYTAGNVQSISTCPATAGLLATDPFVSRFVCLVGDGDAAAHTGAEWDRRFGQSTATLLAAAIPFSLRVGGQQQGPSICHGPQQPDQFANGPIPCDIPVVSLAGLVPGALFAISSADDDFEMPVIESVDARPFAGALYGGWRGDETQAMAWLRQVRSGAFQVEIDGQMRVVSGVDLSHAESLAAVAAALRIPGAEVRYVAAQKRFEVTSSTTGAGSRVSFLTAAAKGEQDLSALLGGTQATGAGLRKGGAGTVRAWLSKSHFGDSLVTVGGGVGYGVNFVADTVAPGRWPESDQGGPDAPYRLAWPIIATLPGNVIVTTQFPYNQGMELGTKAFAANRMTTAPSFRPVITAGRWTGVADVQHGRADLPLPAGTNAAGGLKQGPMPTFSFAGCTVAPTGHYEPINGVGSFQPVIDTAGAGCPDAPRVTFSGAWANAYEIHVAGWIRSDYDPEFDRRYPHNPNTPAKQGDFHQVVTPATANYYALDGAAACSATGGFCKGDAVEQVYDQHQQQGSIINFVRPVYNIGTTGGIMSFNYRGHGGGDSLLMVSNLDPAANFYGTAASRYFPDGQGHGGVRPPTGMTLSGTLAEAISLDQLPAENVTGGGTVLAVHCGYRDRTAPCRNGDWWPYRLWAGDAAGGDMQLVANPRTGVLSYEPHGSFRPENGSFPGMRTALVGETQAQTVVLGGRAAGGSGGALYLLGARDTRAGVDAGGGGCVLVDDGTVKFRCGTRMLLHDVAGWDFDGATPVAFDHVVNGTAPPAGDRSRAIPTTEWVAAAIAAAGSGSGAMKSVALTGTLGVAAGSGASGLRLTGSADSFQVTFTTGSASAGGAAMVQVGFAQAYAGVQTCLVNGGDDAAMAVPVYAKGVGPDGFSLWVPATAVVPKQAELVYSVQCR